MDFSAVEATLLDLPPTFTRSGGWFAQLMDSTSFASSLETEGNTDILTQVLAFANAQDGWIDIWGLLFGVPRNQNEGNGPYATRISETILAWVGTIPAVEYWVNTFAPGGSVVVNTSGFGYSVILPVAMTTAQVVAFLLSFNRIRPIGVPFTVLQGGGALYLGTVVYMGDGPMIGDYLGGSTTLAGLINGITLNAVPLLPSLMFTDPVLNPNLA
jgi:hypothetical protein